MARDHDPAPVLAHGAKIAADTLPRGAVSALVILTIINFVSLFDRVQISALAHPIKVEFGLSDTQVGMLTGLAFGLTYATAAIPLAWLSDRGNRSRLLAGALLFWSAMTAFAGLAQSFWHLFATRVGVAAGEAAFTPTAHSILADYYPPRRRALAIGIETSGVSLGIMGGMAAAGWVGSEYGWRYAMFVAGVPGLIMALVTWIWLREPARTSRIAAAAIPPAQGRSRFHWAGRGYGWLVVVAVCNSIMTTGWTQWLPSFFIRTYDLPLSTVGVSVGVASGLGLTCGSILGGWVSARADAANAGSQFRLCILISLAVVPLYGLALWSPTPALGFFGVFVSTVAAGMLAPFIFAGIQNACDPDFRARAVAFALMFVTIGSYGIMPVAVGALSDVLTPAFGQDSLRAALSSLMAVPFVAAFVFARIGRSLAVTDPAGVATGG
jgi:predicted MFS family arabinose efflux permease